MVQWWDDGGGMVQWWDPHGPAAPANQPLVQVEQLAQPQNLVGFEMSGAEWETAQDKHTIME